MYCIYRHEGGKIVKRTGPKDGPFESKEAAQERASELNREIDIARGGFKVHEAGYLD